MRAVLSVRINYYWLSNSQTLTARCLRRLVCNDLANRSTKALKNSYSHVSE